MTTPLSVLALLAAQTADQIFDLTLGVARVLGLPVTSWRVGDPTRTLFRAQAEQLATRDAVQADYAATAFLETATGEFLTVRASDTYGVTRTEATYATSTVTLVNAGGGFFELDSAGLVVSSTATGATFQNQSPVTIEPLSTVEVSMVAQAAGSAGSVAEDDIDTIVSPALAGVTVTASTAGLGADEQSDPGLREQCLATLGALSPAGPADAYEFVARSAELTGIDGVTRARADGDSSDGTGLVYVATATAGLDAPSIAAIQAAVDEWAQPLCTDATVATGLPQTINITMVLTPASPLSQTLIEQTLTIYLAGVDLGGVVARSAIIAEVHRVLGAALVTMTVSAPAADVTLAADRFPVRGTVSLS